MRLTMHCSFGALGTTAVKCVSSVFQPAILASDLVDLACTPDRVLSCQQPHRFFCALRAVGE